MFSWGKAKDGPYFLKRDYPAGFQPLRPESSLINALEVIKQINIDLQAQVKTVAAPDSTGNARQEVDHQQCEAIISHITQLIAKIDALNGYLASKTLVELNQNSDEVIGKVNEIVGAAVAATASLTPTGAQSITAFNALADVLHITRRSIPDIEVFKEHKETIRSARNTVLETKNQTQCSITSNLKAGMSEIREAGKGHGADKPDRDSAIKMGNP